MVESNKPTKEYLDYYTSLKVAPNYAVLINGDWGSGKTWFTKSYFEDKEDVKSVYITLYGVSSFEEIDNQFFQQLYPVLSSQGMMIASKILKGLAKGALKIDLDDDIDITKSEQLPEFLKNTEDYVLIFDDLERAKLEPERLLGYINRFVEHDGRSVIIIANEDEIDSNDGYKRVKEKVVGRTLSVKPSFDEAFDAFIDEMNGESLREKIKKYKKLIQTIFKNSESNNLRYLRYGLTELNRLISELKNNLNKSFDNEELVKDLIGFYFALSIEINRGELPIKVLKDFNVPLFSILSGKDGNNKKFAVTKMIERYPMVTFENPVFKDNFWYKFFKNGIVDVEQIKAVGRSPRYFEDKAPTWAKLWNYYDLTNQDFDEVIEEVEKKFDENSFSDFKELTHITGSLMKLSDVGIYQKSKKQINAKAKEQVDKLFDKDKVKIEFKAINRHITDDNSMGYQYQGTDICEFKDFRRYYQKKYENKKDKIIQRKVDEIVSNLASNLDKFIQFVYGINYDRFSVFNILSKTKFNNQLMKLTPRGRREVLSIIEKRIYARDLDNKELAWIKEMVKVLKNKYPPKSELVEDHVMQKAIKGLESALSNDQRK